MFWPRLARTFALTLAVALASVKAALPDLYEASIAELQAGLAARHFTSVDLVRAYFARIDEVNTVGPTLRAVGEKNPSALRQAAVLDEERSLGLLRGPLHGIPILVKDNIATVVSEGMNTTAGSFALLGSVPPRDAHVITKLREAGAIILGKANLWAHFRGSPLASGWTGRFGQCTNPYFPNADPSGSSSGSAVSAAIGLVAGTLGTETDGSITSPSSKNNLVGIKPTVGLTSRAGVVPISSNQDTVGPIVRSVADGATILSVIAGRDPRDNFTLAQPARVPNYTHALVRGGLRGARIGVPRVVFTDPNFTGAAPAVLQAFNASLHTLRGLGATIVDPADLPSALEIANSDNETFVLDVDFKIEVAKYIAELEHVPTGVKTLADLIAFNSAHVNLELPPPFYNSQSIFIESEATTGKNATYQQSLTFDHELGRTRGIDAALQAHHLDALVLPSPGFTTVPAAIAGYPLITVPLGFLPDNTTATKANPTISTFPGQPFGLAFLGTAFSEFNLIKFAFDYEQATHMRLKKLAFAAAIPKTQLADVIGK